MSRYPCRDCNTSTDYGLIPVWIVNTSVLFTIVFVSEALVRNYCLCISSQGTAWEKVYSWLQNNLNTQTQLCPTNKSPKYRQIYQISTIHINFANTPCPKEPCVWWRSGRDLHPAPLWEHEKRPSIWTVLVSNDVTWFVFTFKALK